MRTGIIYRYLNIESGKSYVGQTVNPKDRFRQHLNSNKKDWHVDYKKYPYKYEYIVVEDNIPEDKLDEREIYWIDYYDSYHNGYNLTEGGQGCRLSEETKKKISEATKGRIPWNKGIPCSEETKRKSSEKQKGIKLSDLRRKNISEGHKGLFKGDKHPMYGKHHNEDAKRKISEASKGKHFYNNGVINVFRKECPEGFIPGRINNI